jgi:hypothetical protein
MPMPRFDPVTVILLVPVVIAFARTIKLPSPLAKEIDQLTLL